MAEAKTKDIAVVKSEVVPRIDGPLKVSGRAAYTSDHNLTRMVFGVPVCATIGKGKVKAIDSKTAEKMKGVLAVYTSANIGPLYRPVSNDGFQSKVDEARPPMEDNIIRYYGQYVAFVVAETFEIAQEAARSIRVTYEAERPNIDPVLTQEDMKKTDTERGKAADTFAKAKYKVNQTYITPVEVHNPIELHSTVAEWSKEKGEEFVTLYETSQAIGTHRNVMAQILNVPKEQVRVITHFLGSGFGGKLWAWPHSALAAASARKLGRPVKVVVDRTMMFTNVGHRPRTQQNIRISADAKGKFQSLEHHYSSHASLLDDFKENCGEVSGFLYDCDHVKVTSGVARRNVSAPTAMRGPGAIPGLFALESAIDELAIQLKMDPVQIRLINDAAKDGMIGKPFSSRHFKECLELGAKKFGWEKRKADVGSMRDGDAILGWGVAACTWPARRLDAEATVELGADGKMRINCGTHDIGTGMYTVLAQIASTETGIPMDRIEVRLGDTTLPPGPIAGGSMAAGSVVPAVLSACRAAIKNVATAATKSEKTIFFKEKADDLKMRDGKITGAKGSVAFAEILKSVNMNRVWGSGSAKGTLGEKNPEFSTKSFGAQFVEVRWQPQIARLRVSRVVTVIDGGHIINFQPARNQIEGGIVMGIGMALFEEAVYDPRYGQPVNNNLADYVVPVHADMPEIDVTFLDYPDKELNELGARGVGEIGLAGVAAAIAGAVYHASGIRIRELPIKVEDLLKAQV